MLHHHDSHDFPLYCFFYTHNSFHLMRLLLDLLKDVSLFCPVTASFTPIHPRIKILKMSKRNEKKGDS